MSNLFNLSEYPALTDTINESVKNLIDETEKAGYINPQIECEIKIEDGRIYKLKFERIDLDQGYIWAFSDRIDNPWRDKRVA
jgi:DNA topoisomerase VI subunit B